MRRAHLALAGLALGSLAPLATARGQADGGPDGGAPPASVARPAVAVDRGRVGRRIELMGRMEAAERLPLFAPEVPGLAFLRVETAVEEGRRVKAGEVLATFEGCRVQTRLRSIDGRLARARTRLAWTEARLEAERLAWRHALTRKGLLEERAALLAIPGVGLQPELQLEAARLDHQLAGLDQRLAQEAAEAFEEEAETEAAAQRVRIEELARERAELQRFLGKMKLSAPLGGLVIKPPVRGRQGKGKLATGMEVRPGDVLLELVEPGKLQASFCVAAVDADVFVERARVRLEPLAFPGRDWPGRLRDMAWGCGSAAEAGDVPRGIRIQVGLEQPEAPARPGLSVRLEAERVLAENALRVPLSAVVIRDDRPWVLLSGNNPAAWVGIRTGRQGDRYVEVLEGLQEGTVIHPSPADRSLGRGGD